MKIKTYRYIKTEIAETELFIPDKPFYCFQTGVRRSIEIIPKFVTWENGQRKKGDVYELDVICVYLSFECIVEKFSINLDRVEDYINRDDRSKPAEICRMLLKEDYYIRTKEQFHTDLENALEQFR